MRTVYEYPARGNRDALTVTWYQGSEKPEIWTSGDIPQWGSGVLFIGNQGMLLSDYRKHVLLPEEEFVDFEYPEPFLPKSIGHHAEWVAACRATAKRAARFLMQVL